MGTSPFGRIEFRAAPIALLGEEQSIHKRAALLRDPTL